MKKIKIKICGLDEQDKFSYGYYILNILKKYYNVELSENPEYIFFNESSSEYFKYDCIRIFFTGENITPNFNLCDYAIGFDYINFEDRYYRLPLYLVSIFYNKRDFELIGNFDLDRAEVFTQQDLDKKINFCSFVYSNYLADQERESIFKKLSIYKKVNSGGAYLNNIGGGVDSKLEFELKHKFSIAFENSSRSGYTTEKIVTSLAAKTVPIYWGDPNISKVFNEKRFINCHNYNNFDQVVERVKEIDQNDKLFIDIINEPIAISMHNFQATKIGFEFFLKAIFDQSLSNASRRTINLAKAIQVEKNEIIIMQYNKIKNFIKRFFSIVYRPFKKINFFENIKHRFFNNARKK